MLQLKLLSFELETFKFTVRHAGHWTPEWGAHPQEICKTTQWCAGNK